jgi:activator of HSP90 ATPase
MATEKIQVSTVLPATPKDIYEAWLDSKKHSAFTGAGATAQPKVGGRHTAWDGYIHGWTLKLESGKRIVQSWRTTEFKPEDVDSVIDVKLAKAKGGTKVTLSHTDIPAGQGSQYEQGWQDHYFRPMEDYFMAKVSRAKKPAKKAAKKK